MAEIEQLKSEAAVIEIRERDVVLADLSESIARENAYAIHAKTWCPIKMADNGRTPPCYECPHFTDDFVNDAMSLVCQLGRHQVDLIGELDAIRAVEELDALLLDTYEQDVAACEELAAALL